MRKHIKAIWAMVLAAVMIVSLLPASVTVMAQDGEQFSDVKKEDVDNGLLSEGAYEAIYWAAENGITKGFSDGTFRPDENTTRQQFVIFLWRLAGEPEVTLPEESPFTDVTSETKGYEAIIWAVENGIIKGYSDGSFKPENDVLRKEAVIMVWRLAGKSGAESAADFSDVEETASYYNAVSWSEENGIIKGYSDGTFRPDNTCLRKEVAVILYRYYNNFIDIEEEEETGFDALPAGTYTYVDADPVAEEASGAGEFEFIYAEDKLVYSFGGEDEVISGEMILTGYELKFMQGMYLSDLPVTDWFGSSEKDTEGYYGDVAGNVEVTITEDGKISVIKLTYAGTRLDAILDESITDETLTIIGITRGQPNLLQSCITLVGSVNGLYLTKQGDVILDGLEIGHDADGVGLRADKIGGDTFVVGTVLVDGTVEWHSLMGVITALSSEPGTLITTGKDINMTGGSNIGRVGRCLNISTGEGGGDINLGVEITTDQSRGGLTSSDGLSDYLTISTSGSISAGTGDVTIGTYTGTDKGLTIDIIGDIQGANVTIAAYDYGELSSINNSVGNIDASGDVSILATTANSGASVVTIVSSSDGTKTFEVNSEAESSAEAFGNITAGGNIDISIETVYGSIGDITAGGIVNISLGAVVSVGEITGSEVNTDITILQTAE